MHAMHLIFAIISVSMVIAVTNARPNQFGSKNVVTVPPNCPEGQVWINNQCRDLWDTFQKTMMFPDSAVEVVPQNIPQDAFDNEEKVNIENQKNVVTVPPNCPPGQIWVNGACRDIWALMSDDQDFLPSNVVVVPPNCPPGQVWMNGACRNRWSMMLNDQQSKNVIVVPPNCPPGQVWMNGACRNWWSMMLNDQQSKNVIVVPPNCPSGTVLIGGHCRPIWRTDFSEAEEQSMGKNEIMADKGVVTVPNHCPAGYRPDALGICRRIF